MMSEGHPFRELTKDFRPERRGRVGVMEHVLSAKMRLPELRRAQSSTQQAVAELLNINQTAVSKLVHKVYACMSSLRSYLEAMGGNVEGRRQVACRR